MTDNEGIITSMRGLYEYLTKLNTLGVDAEKVANEEIDHIRKQFELPQGELDNYSRRKYLWKLIATSYILKDDFISHENPLGLEECLTSFEKFDILNKEVSWNAINILYSPIMSDKHWKRILHTILMDFNTDVTDDESLEILKSDLIGLNYNVAFVSPFAVNELKSVLMKALEVIDNENLNTYVITLVSSLVSLKKEDFIPDLPKLINQLSSHLNDKKLPILNLFIALIKSNPSNVNYIQGPTLEFYSSLSTQFIDQQGETNFHGVTEGWAMIRTIQLLTTIGLNESFHGNASIALIKKISEAVLKSIKEELQKNKDKEGKLLLGSLFLNNIYLLGVLGDGSVIKVVLNESELGIINQETIFMDNTFRSEIISVIIKLVDLFPQKTDVILKYARIWKKLLHSKDENLCSAIENLLLKLSDDNELSFAQAKIILVILFDKFVRTDQKVKPLSCILKVMDNQLKSGVVRYAILKLIKAWITLGSDGDQLWSDAFQLVKLCVSNSSSGTSNPSSISDVQVRHVDKETAELRFQIIKFIHLGLLSIPDKEIPYHKSFFMLTLSVLKINAQSWSIGDLNQQIKTLLEKYPVASFDIQDCILETITAYYPVVDSHFKYSIIELLNNLFNKENADTMLAKKGKLCYSLLESELRFLKFDQGILFDSQDIGIKILYRTKSENNIVTTTFNIIGTEELKTVELSIFNETSDKNWKLKNKVAGVFDPNVKKTKYEFEFEVESFYDIQEEPILNVETDKGRVAIRSCILMKTIQQGGQMSKAIFDARWDQVFRALGSDAYDSRCLKLQELSVEWAQRLLMKLGFGIVSIDVNSNKKWELKAGGLARLDQSAVGVLLKVSETGDLEVLLTQPGLVKHVSSRIEAILCSDINV